MKYYSFLLLLLFANTAGAYTFTGTHGTTGVYHCANGTDSEVQAAANDTTSSDGTTSGIKAGDTILIPPGTWTWLGPVTIGGGTSGLGGAPKNIKILGDCGGGPCSITAGTLPKILSTASLPQFIHFTTEDGSGKTAEIGYLEFNGFVTDFKLLADGVTTMRDNGTGGMRVHDCRWVLPYYSDTDVVRANAVIVNGSKRVSVPDYNFLSTDVQAVLFGPSIPITTPAPASLPTLTIIASVGPSTTVTTTAGTGATNLIVGDTTDFLSSGNIIINKATYAYTAKTGTTFTLASPGAPVGGIPSGAVVTQVPSHVIQMSQAATCVGTCDQHLTIARNIPDPAAKGAPQTSNINHGWIHFQDWVEGVVDHNEVDSNLMWGSTGSGLVNHGSSPEWSAALVPNVSGPHGIGGYGDYAFCHVPAGKQDWAATFHGMYYEDNLIKYGNGNYTDTGALGNQGGGIQFHRYNTSFAAQAMHGTIENDATTHGGRLTESYNCLFLQGLDANERLAGLGATEARDGEFIAYNNYISGQKGVSGNGASMQTWWGIGTLLQSSYSRRFQYAPDGLNPWYENAKGNASGTYTDPNGMLHHIDATYTYRRPPTGTDPTLDPDAPTPHVDQVTLGKDSDSRLSDVFGHVTADSGTITQGGSNTCGTSNTPKGYPPIIGYQCYPGVTIQGTDLSGIAGTPASSAHPIPKDYFRGFVITNAEADRSIGKSSPDLFCFGYIAFSSQGFGTNGNTVDLVLTTSNIPAGAYHALFNISGTHKEIRRIKTYYGITGQGHMDTRIKPGSDPAELIENGTGAYTPIRWTQAVAGGCWGWGNWARVGMAPFKHETVPLGRIDPTTGIYGQTLREVHYYVADTATKVVPAAMQVAGESAQGMQPLFSRGYPWNPKVTADSSDTRQWVGAHWGKQFFDHGVLVADMRTGGGNTFSPEYASFVLPPDANNKVGLGGATYPHPLVQTPAARAPAFVSPCSGSTCTIDWALNVSNTTTISANGTVPITISQSGKPSYVTFTDNGDSTATISGTPTATGDSTFTITAANGTSPNASQSITISVSSPTCALAEPTEGERFIAPANIQFKATASGPNSINRVDFYQVPALPALPNFIGSDNTSPYEDFVWSSVAAGTYTVKARAVDSLSGFKDSDTVTITVVTPAPPVNVTPATIQVHQ